MKVAIEFLKEQVSRLCEEESSFLKQANLKRKQIDSIQQALDVLDKQHISTNNAEVSKVDMKMVKFLKDYPSFSVGDIVSIVIYNNLEVIVDGNIHYSVDALLHNGIVEYV